MSWARGSSGDAMSTSYYTFHEVFRLCQDRRITCAIVEHSDPPEYRLHKDDAMIFQGTAERCSDFLTGWKASAKAVSNQLVEDLKKHT